MAIKPLIMNETIENNKLIAEFMGVAKRDITNDGGGIYVYESPISGEYEMEDDLQYDSSWDWLMPVVEKAIDVYGNMEYKFGRTYPIKKVTDALRSLEGIEVVYSAVVEFIKWHNSNSVS